MEDNRNENQEFGNMLGRAFGYVVVLCLAAICMATTARLILWIL